MSLHILTIFETSEDCFYSCIQCCIVYYISSVVVSHVSNIVRTLISFSQMRVSPRYCQRKSIINSILLSKCFPSRKSMSESYLIEPLLCSFINCFSSYLWNRFSTSLETYTNCILRSLDFLVFHICHYSFFCSRNNFNILIIYYLWS